jgi:GNAT superfamily N-acetyltransferase
MNVEYETGRPVSADQFEALLRASGLAERRPVDDHECLEGMVGNANLVVTAWDGDKLVGIARSMTDFHYAWYLSDLAVDQACQGRGIGTALQAITQAQLGPRCKLILIAAPAANAYYEHIGYVNNPRCWVLERNQSLKDKSRRL